MAYKKKIMFLDFDGCCNSYGDGSYVTNDNETYGPSKGICESIRNFCLENDVKIVISSNWRKFDEDGFCIMGGKKIRNPIKKMIDSLGNDIIIGTLPKERHIVKSKCLILWFEDNGDDFDYVIFDDDFEEDFQNTFDYGIKDHFILIDPKTGITEKDLEKAGKIINI